jgi:carbonic anhydrase
VNTPLVVVLGHSKCGAVEAAIAGGPLLGSLPKLMEEIRPAVEAAKKKDPSLKGDALVEEAVKQNVWKAMEDLLRGSAPVGEAVKKHQAMIVGAIRDLKTGRITWLGEHPKQAALLASGK